MVTFIEVSIDQRIEIERMCNADEEILNYLKLLEGQDKRELAAKLLGDFESVAALEQTFGDLT